MEEIMAEKENKTIIFVETKKRCDDLTRRMRRDGWVHESGVNAWAKINISGTSFLFLVVVLYSLVCAVFMMQDLHHNHVHSVVDQEILGNRKERTSFQG